MQSRTILIAALQLCILAALPARAEIKMEQLSAQEKKWFETFQNGTLYARGWKEITAQILAKVPPEIKKDLQRDLNELGVKIGREWCKNNSIRKIDNTMLKQWGCLLEQAAEQNPDKIPQVVANLSQKVVALLD